MKGKCQKESDQFSLEQVEGKPLSVMIPVPFCMPQTSLMSRLSRGVDRFTTSLLRDGSRRRSRLGPPHR